MCEVRHDGQYVRVLITSDDYPHAFAVYEGALHLDDSNVNGWCLQLARRVNAFNPGFDNDTVFGQFADPVHLRVSLTGKNRTYAAEYVGVTRFEDHHNNGHAFQLERTRIVAPRYLYKGIFDQFGGTFWLRLSPDGNTLYGVCEQGWDYLTLTRGQPAAEPEPKAEPKEEPVAKTDPKSEPKPEPKAEPKPEPKKAPTAEQEAQADALLAKAAYHYKRREPNTARLFLKRIIKDFPGTRAAAEAERMLREGA